MREADFRDAVDLLMYATKIHGELYQDSGLSRYKALLTTVEMLEMALRIADALATERRAAS